MTTQTESAVLPGIVAEGRSELLTALDARPRFPLAQLPTPLHLAPHLSERLGVRVLLKRDDQTGLALGGNKARKLEYLIGDALAQGADTIVTTGGSQSNHARMTAAACCQAGLECWLVLDRGIHPEFQGNLLLDHVFGAQVTLIESSDPADAIAEMNRTSEALDRQGHKAYVVPRGGSTPQGASGYARAVVELVDQIAVSGESITHLYLVTGSTGTHAGVMAGVTALGWNVTVQGISVSRSAADQSAKVLDLANATLTHLGLTPRVDPNRVLVDDGYRGTGYGQPTTEAMDAIRYAARDEGVLLDPVYTAKCMAGLANHVREGRFGPGDTVVFLHTGGAPALFAYHDELAQLLGQPT